MTFLSRHVLLFLAGTLCCLPGVRALDLEVDLDRIGVKAPVKQQITGHVLLSRYEQASIAKELVRQLRATGKVVAAPEITAYISTLGNRLARYSGVGQPLQFLVINDDSINAFAALGGVIAVHSGMILAAQSEEELASVLAHEIAHISQHHIERAIEAGKSGNALLTQALLLALAVAVGGKNPKVSQAAVTVASGLQIQKAITHTRLHEIEADAVGINLLSQAGYSPKAMGKMFQTLAKGNRFSSSRLPSFLRTHPLTEARVAKAETLATRLPAKGTVAQGDFQAIQQLVRLHTQKQLSSKDTSHSAAKLTYAMQRQALGQTAVAKAAAQQALAKPGTSVYFKLLAGQYYTQAKNPTTALRWYRNAYKQDSRNLGTTLRLVEGLLQAGQVKQAKTILDKAVKQFVASPTVRKEMAKYYAYTGQQAASYFWQAEYAYLSGYTKQAVAHLLRAKRISKAGFYLGSKIEARLKEYQRIAALEKKS